MENFGNTTHKKPKKWGFKFFAFCGRSGLIHRIEPYTGRFSDTPVTSAIRKSGSVLVRLLDGIEQHKNHKVIFDNWFTSPALMIELGTLRLCRAPGLNFSTDREMALNGRGSFEEKVCNVDGVQLTAIHWHDNKSVKVISTFVGADPVTSIRRWDAKINVSI